MATNEQLALDHQRGDPDAMGRLIKKNRGLICKIARRYHPNQLINEDHDAFQAGTVAIWIAAKTFDPKRRCTFVTHSYRIIQTWVCREWARSRVVYVPPSTFHGKKGAGRKKAREAANYQQYSLDPSAFQQDTKAFEQVVQVGQVGQELEDRETLGKAKALVETYCNDKERFVFWERILKERGLKEVGEDLKVCKERVRQLEKGVLDMLRENIE